MQRHAAADSLPVALQYVFHGRAVARPYLLGPHLAFELLEGPEKPEGGVRRDFGRGAAGEHAVAHLPHQRIQCVDAVLLVSLFERDARQRDEGLAARNPVPRISRHHFGPVTRTTDQELPRRVFETADEVDLMRTPRDGCGENLFDGLGRAHFVERRREDDALALLELRFEIARREQVFVPLVSAGQLLLVFESVIPVGRGHELRAGFARLEIEPRERVVETALHAVYGGVGVSVGLHVGVRQRMPVHERVADHQLRPLVDPEHLLLEDYAAHAVGDLRRRRILEIGDILVAARLVYPPETVQRQIERLVVLHHGLVERREQDVGPAAVVDGGHHQSVIAAGVAADDRRTHVAADTVRREHFALEGVLQIAQFAFVESKC